MMTTTVEPIRLNTIVPLPPDEAFELFTTRVQSWWPIAVYAVFPGNTESVTFEHRVGGRIIERSRTGEEGAWGEVLSYDKPNRVVLTWHPGGGPATEIEVRFTAADDGTYVELEHRGWEAFAEQAENARSTYANDWPLVLADRFASAAAARAAEMR